MLKNFIDNNNWIIPPWDSRYGKLGHLWNHYIWNERNDPGEYNQLVCYNDHGNIFYYIPPEIVINEYVTSKIKIYNKHTIPSDDNWDNWVYSNKFNRLISITTGLNMIDYYNLFKLKINSNLDTPRCPVCKSRLKFWRLWSGYTKFCSNECSSYYQMTNPDLYPGDNHFSELNNDPYFHTKSECMKFINAGNRDDECYLYHAITESGKFKFGVTSDYLEGRLYHSRVFDRYLSIELDHANTRETVAYIEASIKLHFNGKEYLELNQSKEYFKLLSEILTRPVSNPFE